MYKSLLFSFLGLFLSFSMHGQSFTLDDDRVCAGEFVTASNDDLGPQPPDFLWVLEDADGNITTDATNWAVYVANINKGSVYTLCLRVPANNTAGQFCRTITGLKLPTAKFDFTPSTGVCIGDEIQFTDRSQEGDAPIVKWFWELEGANTPNTSGDKNPEFEFGPGATPGCKDVTLLLTDAEGCKNNLSEGIFSDTICIDVPPTPSFTVGTIGGCTIPYDVTFTNTTPNSTGLTFTWDFGDGSPTSSAVSPTHQYQTGGPFNVTLTVSNGSCSREVVKNNAVSSTDLGVDIVTDIDAGCPPLRVTFGANNTTGGLSYDWEFQGGIPAISGAKNNVVVFDTPGKKIIKLTASDGDGCTDVKYDTITVTNAPKADFTVLDPSSCLSNHCSGFQNTSTDASQFQWIFPGGTPNSSNQQDPGSVCYDPGDYNVTLIAISGDCSDTLTKSPAIAIGSPLIQILATNRIGCVGEDSDFAVDITAPAGVTVGTPIWDFDDAGATGSGASESHNFSTDGVFDVTVTVPFSGNGCTNQTRTVQIKRGLSPGKPTGSHPSRVCVGEPFVFNCTSSGPGISCYWRPGKGIPKVQGCSPGYNYSDPAGPPGFETWLVCAVNGCKDSSRIGNIVVDPPQANMTIAPVCGSATEYIFTNNSLNAQNTYFEIWTNGDESNKEQITGNFSRDFEDVAPGTFTIKVFAQRFDGNMCKDSLDRTVNIPKPLSPPIARPTNGCVGTEVIFKDSLASFELEDIYNQNGKRGNLIVGWTWDFLGPEGLPAVATATGRNVKFTYDEVGTYTATLTRTYQNNVDDIITTCDEVITIPININGVQPDIDVTPQGGCILDPVAGLDIDFSDQSTVSGGGNIVSREWYFNDALIPNNAKDFTLNFKKDTVITVRLEVEDDQGCIGIDEIPLRIGNSLANIDVDTRVSCTGRPVQFSADSSVGLNLSYFWNFGDPASGPNFNTSTLANPTHIYNSTGNYTVTLIVEDSISKTCQDTIIFEDYIEIVDFNVDFIGLERSANCPELITTFEILPPYDKLDYSVIEWDFGNGKTGTDADSILTIYTNIGPPGQNGPFYDVSLHVETANGCVDDVVKPQYIEVGGPGGDFTFTPDSGCVGDIVTYHHNTRGATRYIWNFHNRSFDGVATDNDFEIPMTEGGVFFPTLTIIDDLGCLVAIKDKTLRISGLNAHAIPDSVTICDQGTVLFEDSSYLDIITATSNPGDVITGREWTLNGAPLSTAATFPYDFTPADEGRNEVILTSNSLFKCAEMDTVIVDVLVTPTPGLPEDKIICKGDKVALNVSGSPDLKVQWFPETEVSNDTIVNPDAFPINDTTLMVLFWEDKDKRCADSAFVNIDVITDLLARAGPDTTICIGDTIQLFADAINTSNGAAQFDWEPFPADASVFIDVSDPRNPRAWPPIDFTYNVTISEPSGFCNTERIPVTIKVGQLPTVDGGVKISGTNEIPMPEVYTFGGQSVDLSAFSPTNVEYSWSINNGPNLCTDCPNTTATPSTYTEYVVKVDEIGCVNYDTVKVFVLDDCEGSEINIANAFTPNNDGINDEIGIDFGPGVEGIIFFRVFNRWGEVVFEDDAPEDQVWDGTHNGKPLNPGVFVYYLEYLCVDGNTAIRKGNITLLK